MYQYLTSITSKGQITIPVELRKHLKVKPRDKVVFVIEKDGLVGLRTSFYKSISSLKGSAGSLKKPLSWPKMKQVAYEDRMKARYKGNHA